MDNHFHLLWHCPDAGLSEAMQRLSSLYTRHVNDSGSSERRERAPRKERSNDSESAPAASGGGVDVVEVSFEDSFDAQLADELGDLGPKSDRPAPDNGGRSGGRRRHR